MQAFLAILTAMGGVFLLLWYRTIVSLPVLRQPHLIHNKAFKWGIPSLSAAAFVLAIYVASRVGLALALTTLTLAMLVLFLAIRFDRYSAEMRLIYDRFVEIRREQPSADAMEALFRTAQWRYPQSPQDRLVELIAGKDIRALILLMIVSENGINPISDWGLYQSLREKADRIIRE